MVSKRRVGVFEMVDPTEQTIRVELESCLRTHASELAMARRVKSLPRSPIDLLSKGARRSGRIGGLLG